MSLGRALMNCRTSRYERWRTSTSAVSRADPESTPSPPLSRLRSLRTQNVLSQHPLLALGEPPPGGRRAGRLGNQPRELLRQFTGRDTQKQLDLVSRRDTSIEAPLAWQVQEPPIRVPALQTAAPEIEAAGSSFDCRGAVELPRRDDRIRHDDKPRQIRLVPFHPGTERDRRSHIVTAGRHPQTSPRPYPTRASVDTPNSDA